MSDYYQRQKASAEISRLRVQLADQASRITAFEAEVKRLRHMLPSDYELADREALAATEGEADE